MLGVDFAFVSAVRAALDFNTALSFCLRLLAGLSRDEIAAVNIFTRDVLYRPLNAALRRHAPWHACTPSS